MDVDKMSGSTLEAMACAVEEAEIILICMSQLYKDSNNCRADKMRDLLNEIDRMYPDSLLKVQPIKEEKLRAVVAVDAVDAAAPNGEQWSPTKYASYRRPKPVIACDMTREFIDTCIPATICADELRMLVDMRHEAPEFFYKCLCKMYKIRNPILI
ncbi:hypothetical protein MAR_006316 [Mya arenaria]|uniref:TIR domain-containing protein n=1 Tax=Mya arenaria TaxID=6604 RepID=A0ABY7DFQ6_MYAAR|nr:hypothetical protein MAR_006316 [Mya arenaria]